MIKDLLKQYRSQLIRIILLLLGVALVYLLFTYTFVTVEISGSINDSSQVTFFNGERQTKQNNSDGGLMLVKRSSNLLQVDSGDRSSIKPISLTPIYSEKIKVKLHPQREVMKIAAQSLGCEVRGLDSAYYTYRCSGGAGIFKYDTSGPRWENKLAKEPGGINLRSPQPYLKGLLSINTLVFNGRRPEVVYSQIKSAVSNQVVSIPTSLRGDINNYRLVTDPSNSSNSRFVIYDSLSRQALLFNDLKDQQPHRLKLADGVKEDPLGYTRCSLLETVLSCIYGRGTDYPEDDVVEDTDREDEGDSMWRYDFNGQIIMSTKIPDNSRVDRFLAVSSDTYLGSNVRQVLYHFKIVKDKIKVVSQISGVSSFSTGAGQTLVIKQNKLYDFKSDQLSLIYKSDNIRLSRLNSSGNLHYFTGFYNNSSQLLHAFAIGDGDYQGERIEDIVPLADNSLPISELDYSGNRLYVKLKLTSYISDHQTGRLLIDQSEFNQVKSKVLSNLRERKLTSKFKTIIFTY